MAIGTGYYAILLTLHPAATAHEKATQDLFWGGSASYLTGYVWIVFIFTAMGLWSNIAGFAFSQMLRFIGGFLGFLLWGWFSIKCYLVGIIVSPGHVWTATIAIFGEGGVMLYAAAGLPRPGAPGNVPR